MLNRKSTPQLFKWFKTSAKVLFVCEAVAFAASYGVWHRMNTNRDFREYIKENFPVVLEGYYSFGELIGGEQSHQIRKLDAAVWKGESATKSS